MLNATLNTTSFVQTTDRSTRESCYQDGYGLLTSHLINTQEMLV